MTMDIYEYWEKNQPTLDSLLTMFNKISTRNNNCVPFTWKMSKENDILIQKAPDIWVPIR